MKYRILSTTDKEVWGANIAVMVDYTDLNALGAVATGSINIAPLNGATNTLPAGSKIQLIGMVLNTQFAGSDSPTTCAVTLGDTGSATRYLASTQLLGGATPITYSAGTGTVYALTATDNVIAAFTDTAKSMANMTAGQVTFYLRIDDLNQFVVPGQ